MRDACSIAHSSSTRPELPAARDDADRAGIGDADEPPAAASVDGGAGFCTVSSGSGAAAGRSLGSENETRPPIIQAARARNAMIAAPATTPVPDAFPPRSSPASARMVTPAFDD